MILGIGMDLCKISRINTTLYRYGDRFKKRCFTNNEIKKCNKVKNSSACYAKRFASKEAVSKALGTGINQGVYWKDIEIINDKLGKPYYAKTKKITKLIKKEFKVKSFNCFLSISDENNYSTAFTIIQSI